jgi:hypothetical protein
MGVHTLADPVRSGAFRHEALFYEGEEAFVAATVPFIVDGLARDEPVMVAVSKRKIGMLEANLGWDGHWIDFVDMAEIGVNPGRIISAWRQFRNAHRDRAVRGIGEPVWAGRTPDELVECRNHELLLNAAFDGGAAWRLMCPYDTTTLDEASLRAARCTHPLVKREGQLDLSADYLEHGQAAASVLEGRLLEPEVAWQEVAFDGSTRADARALVARLATGLPQPRAAGMADRRLGRVRSPRRRAHHRSARRAGPPPAQARRPARAVARARAV